MDKKAATDEQKSEVRQMIDAYFRFAGVAFTWDGTVNDQVAAVFGTMLAETAKCSQAIALVPLPVGGPPGVLYWAEQLGRGVYNSLYRQMSPTCAKRVIQVWGGNFREATMGISSTRARLHEWA